MEIFVIFHTTGSFNAAAFLKIYHLLKPTITENNFLIPQIHTAGYH